MHTLIFIIILDLSQVLVKKRSAISNGHSLWSITMTEACVQILTKKNKWLRSSINRSTLCTVLALIHFSMAKAADRDTMGPSQNLKGGSKETEISK